MDEVVSNIREAGWLQAIKLCSQSGLTTRAWCKENNVNERQYYYWQKKIRSQAASNLSLDLGLVATLPAAEQIFERESTAWQGYERATQ